MRDLIRKILADDIVAESKSLMSESKRVKLSSGNLVEFGSKRHINEIDRMIYMLDSTRRNMIGNNRKLRKERYTISRAIESLRFIKRKAEKHKRKMLES